MNLSSKLRPITVTKEISLYHADTDECPTVRKIVLSTPETRLICNDPAVAGIDYTSKLRDACAKAIEAMSDKGLSTLREHDTIVFHILRGGLNFGLREAVHSALGFNNHCSAFISAQRARKEEAPEDWIITESHYQKLHLKPDCHIIFGDVVATGTSLEHALKKVLDAAGEQRADISSLLFFTIGGPRSHKILEGVDRECRSRFSSYMGSTVVYIEGIFEVATHHTPMSIKIDGTDLVRAGSLMAPEFIESQYEAPSFPLERCTIYDAGSRAFDYDEYIHDVHEYWQQTLELAMSGMTFQALLKERFPLLDSARYGDVDLADICRRQLARFSADR